jgi:hypothetical protein
MTPPERDGIPARHVVINPRRLLALGHRGIAAPPRSHFLIGMAHYARTRSARLMEAGTDYRRAKGPVDSCRRRAPAIALP